VKAPGCDAGVLTVTATVRAALVPQAFVAVTLTLPEVAFAANEMLTELPEPVIVAPVPE
jgi:hypothetical protein